MRLWRYPPKPLSSSGLGHRPFKAAARVRIPLGAPGFPDLPGGQKLDSTTSPPVVLFLRRRRFPSVPGPARGTRLFLRRGRSGAATTAASVICSCERGTKASEAWSCRAVGVLATLSRWRSRVQIPSGPQRLERMLCIAPRSGSSVGTSVRLKSGRSAVRPRP